MQVHQSICSSEYGYKYMYLPGSRHSQFDSSAEQKYPSIRMMLKVCLAFFFVVSLLANNAFGFGCQNEGQTCSWMNGNTCCSGLTCQNGIGNIQICRRNFGGGIGGGIGGGLGCRRRNDECRINGIPAMSCCASLRCLPGYMNRMTCQ